MTIATWFKADDFGVQDSRIVSKASGEGINDHYWMISSTPVRDTYRLRMRLKTRNGVTNTLIGSKPLVEGEWTHVAVTFDGTLLRMYVNGVEDGLLPVTGEIARDVQPAWSPNGAEIAFVTSRYGLPEVAMMNADGTNIRRLTLHGGSAPVWSLDGAYIIYETTENGNRDLYRMRRDGTQHERLTQYAGADYHAVWRP